MLIIITKYYEKITRYKNGFEKKITTENITRDIFVRDFFDHINQVIARLIYENKN